MTDDPQFPEDTALLDAIGALRRPKAPEQATADFMKRVGTNSVRRRGMLPPWFGEIAAALLVLGGAAWWFEHRDNAAADARQDAQIAALQSISTSGRLQAIASAEAGASGERIEQSLVTVMLTDENASVRMAAAEALGRIAAPRSLAPALRQALGSEASTFVQLALLQATDSLPASERKQVLQTLLNRTGVEPLVISDARIRLTQIPEGELP